MGFFLPNFYSSLCHHFFPHSSVRRPAEAEKFKQEKLAEANRWAGAAAGAAAGSGAAAGEGTGAGAGKGTGAEAGASARARARA